VKNVGICVGLLGTLRVYTARRTMLFTRYSQRSSTKRPVGSEVVISSKAANRRRPFLDSILIYRFRSYGVYSRVQHDQCKAGSRQNGNRVILQV
jgi:hypothetical protein